MSKPEPTDHLPSPLPESPAVDADSTLDYPTAEELDRFIEDLVLKHEEPASARFEKTIKDEPAWMRQAHHTFRGMLAKYNRDAFRECGCLYEEIGKKVTDRWPVFDNIPDFDTDFDDPRRYKGSLPTGETSARASGRFQHWRRDPIRRSIIRLVEGGRIRTVPPVEDMEAWFNKDWRFRQKLFFRAKSAAPSDFASTEIKAADRIVAALVEKLSTPPAELRTIYELPEVVKLQRCIDELGLYGESATGAALSGDGELYYPARHFDQFNISGDVLRKTKTAGRLRFRKVRRHNHYSEPDARRLRPDRFITAKRESP